MSENYLASEICKPMRQRDLLASLTMDQNFLTTMHAAVKLNNFVKEVD